MLLLNNDGCEDKGCGEKSSMMGSLGTKTYTNTKKNWHNWENVETISERML